MGQENPTGGGLNISSAPSPNSAPPTSHTSGHKRKVSEWVWVEAPYGFLHWKSCLEPMASTDSSSTWLRQGVNSSCWDYTEVAQLHTGFPFTELRANV